MRRKETSAYELALRYVGLHEVPGKLSNPAIMAMLKLDSNWPNDDETPWCSAFANWIAWHLRLPRSKSLLARSWLSVGEPIMQTQCEPGFDIVVLQRGGGNQPGPDDLTSPGHVGWFASWANEMARVMVLGGNQGNSVSIVSFPVERVLGFRRLA